MKNILVIQTAFPGDAILTLPFIQLLKKDTKAVIDVLAIPSTAKIFESSEYIHKTIVYDKKNNEKSLGSFFRLIKNIKTNGYDTVYTPHRSARSVLIAYYSGASKRIGFDTAAMNFLLTKRVKYISSDHEVKRNLSLLGNFENDDWKILPEITDSVLPDEIERKISDNVRIAIAPGSVWETKKYPVSYFKEIVENLVQRGIQVFLIGGIEDRELCSRLDINPDKSTFNIAGKLSIPQSITFLKKCSCVISNDSAPTHMGVAADIPVITIYCSTIPEFGFYPYNSKSVTMSYEGLKCKPCGIHGFNACPENTFDCANNLKPSTVLEKLNSILAQ